jgi:hypothetical protein
LLLLCNYYTYTNNTNRRLSTPIDWSNPTTSEKVVLNTTFSLYMCAIVIIDTKLLMLRRVYTHLNTTTWHGNTLTNWVQIQQWGCMFLFWHLCLYATLCLGPFYGPICSSVDDTTICY